MTSSRTRRPRSRPPRPGSPRPSPLPPPRSRARAPPAPGPPQPAPDPLTLLQDSVRDRLTEVARIATDETFRLLRPTELEARVRQLASGRTSAAPDVLRPAPRGPLHGAGG